MNRTKFGKNVTVKPGFRRIRVTKHTSEKDVHDYLEKNRGRIVQNLRLAIDKETDPKRKKQLLELLELVKNAKNSRDWREVIQTAITSGIGGLTITAVSTEALMSEGMALNPAFASGVAVSLVTMTFLSKEAIRKDREQRGEKIYR